MRVLNILSNPGIGGTETLLFSLIPFLEKRGCKVDILNVWHNSMMKQPAMKAGLSYSELSGKGRFIGIRDIIKVIRMIRQGDYHIVCAFGLRISVLLRVLRVFFKKTPLVIGLHGVDDWRKWYHTWLDRLTKGSCDMFLPISQTVANVFAAREKIRRDKMTVIKNGTDVQYYDNNNFVEVNKKSLNLPEEKILVTTLANLRYEKGHDFYVDVIERYLDEFENVHFLWIGRGSLKAAIEKKLDRIAASHKVTMIEYVEDVRPFLSCSDLFVLPSQEEGMPRALMEAMAMSVPCVATNVGGVSEVIENGISGLIADFGDVENFGKHIVTLVSSENLRCKTGKAARERIEKHFDIQKIAEKYVKFFKMVKSGCRSGREIQEQINL